MTTRVVDKPQPGPILGEKGADTPLARREVARAEGGQDRADPITLALSVINHLLPVIEQADGYGYDPYDARCGRLYEYLCHHSDTPLGLIGWRMLYFCELIHPTLYRRLRGIKPHWDPMGNSYRVGAHLTLYLCDGDEAHLAKARAILDRIRDCLVGTAPRRGFGLGFPTLMGARQLIWMPDMPISHTSVRVGRKFLLWEAVTGDGTYAEVADEVARFLAEGLAWGQTDGLTWVGYAPVDPAPVVNIWGDVASYLAAHDASRKMDAHRERVLGLIRTILEHQDTEGWWPYEGCWCGSKPAVDNYHTAMVLGALSHLCKYVPEDHRERIRASLDLGLRYYLDTFFDEDTGRFRCFPGKNLPVDPSGIGDALYAFHHLEDHAVGMPRELLARMNRIADRSVEWAIRNLRTAKGRFYSRIVPLRKVVLDGVRRWDGEMCDALALYYAARTLPPEKRGPLWV